MKRVKNFNDFLNEAANASPETIEKVDKLTKDQKFDIWVHYCNVQRRLCSWPMPIKKDNPDWKRGLGDPQYDTETMALYYPCRDFKSESFEEFCKEDIYDWYWRFEDELKKQKIITENMKHLKTFESFCEVCQGPCDISSMHSKIDNSPSRDIDDEESSYAIDQKIADKIYGDNRIKISSQYAGPGGPNSVKHLKEDPKNYSGKNKLTDISKLAIDQKIADKAYTL